MASQADDMEDLNNARAVPALALAQHVNFPPELWAKIFQELEDHPDTMRSASLACRALRGVAQELLFRHVVIKEPSRIVRLIMPEVSRRVAALTTRLSLLVPSEDTEDYKQRVLEPVYALLAHAVPGAELQLRYLRIKSGLLAQLYDVFMDARRPRSPPAEEDEDVIGVGAQEAVDASEVELHGLQALQELSVVYEPTTCLTAWHKEPNDSSSQSSTQHSENGWSPSQYRSEGTSIPPTFRTSGPQTPFGSKACTSQYFDTWNSTKGNDIG
ncbi:hypothetical protein K466DRAFT_603245 [Polyporus arcularius HHB13444]|uniref:Uncharacterized protein n=1 Tax=Polyporus arcularius HHB13444 TaxID=1314778 RepID=A0A5C3PAX9_9APHY|nr:hypothetical protein K466DRAFT_603245 [Polyporus arcularius HHB13444]